MALHPKNNLVHGPKRKPPAQVWNIDPMKKGKPPVRVKPKKK